MTVTTMVSFVPARSVSVGECAWILDGYGFKNSSIVQYGFTATS